MTLAEVSGTKSEGCVVDTVVAAGLLSLPGGDSLGVHQQAYPAGALRGDLC